MLLPARTNESQNSLFADVDRGHGAKPSGLWITVRGGPALQVPEAPADADSTGTLHISPILTVSHVLA